MRRYALFLPFVLVAVLPLVAQDKPRPPRKVALLVGPKTYLHDFKPLPHLDDDVKALAEELRKGGFDEVVVLTDEPEGKNPATKENIVRQLDRLLTGNADKVKNVRKNDVVFLALSGHGQEVFRDGKKNTFFAPIDGKRAKPGSLVDLGEVFDKLAESGGRNVILADMCREIFDPNKGKGVDTDSLKLPRGCAVLFGCESTQESFVNSELKHSLFTYAVLEVMREANRKAEPLLWSELVSGVERKFGSTEFKKLMGPDRQQSPVPRVSDLKATTLLAAVARGTDEKVEVFTWKGEKRTRVVRVLELDGEKVEFVKVSAGSFKMGAPESPKNAWSSEKPQHSVTFTKDLWVAKYPVTKGQYAAFVKGAGYTSGDYGFGFDGKRLVSDKQYSWMETGWKQTDLHPVTNVTWDDAEAFCKWASKASKSKIRLLSEAEYEYANRGGTTTVYFTGDEIESLQGYANIADNNVKMFNDFSAAAFDDGEMFTSKVGKYYPNGFGLYDMTGNVWSWCADMCDDKHYKRDDVTDPIASMTRSGSQDFRVLRGGSWGWYPFQCRATFRQYMEHNFRTCIAGFRIAMESGK